MFFGVEKMHVNFTALQIKSYSIKEVARLFKYKIKYLPSRKGERYASALAYLSLSNKISRYFGKIDLKDYIQKNFCKNHKN